MISTQFSKAIKIFRTDNAMEYRDSQFLDFIHTQGTIIQRSCAGTSQQNGEAGLTAIYTIIFHLQFSKMCLPLNASMTPDLPLATPLAPPSVVDPILDQAFDLPLAAPIVDSPVSPQEPAPLMDPVTDQTPLLPLRRSEPAMIEELQTLEKTHTWDLVDLPCGYAQKYGIDYEESFAPVARITSVRNLLTIVAVHQHLQVIQIVLTKFVFFVALFMVFTLFIRRSDKGMILLLLYVDDMIITGNDHSGISNFKQFLHQQFEMKDFGYLSYFLGLEVSFNSTGYYLSQAKYASDLLSRASLTDTKVVFTPFKMIARLTPLDGTPLSDATFYRQLVGSLVYLTVTRPDIAHVVHLVSQFLVAPHSTHYAAVIHILRYIKGTMFHGLHFSAHSTLDLYAYSDADWAGDPTDRRSTTGFCFFLGDSFIS
uniref:Reverse transcriptase Ty1/copia-type domain-containing protein n=1 Tax=Fagus sylvatica TaxID=28930 RepID=A0A2N9EX08_FAGSY